MTVWILDALFAFAGGLLPVLVSATFDWLDHDRRYQKARNRILGAQAHDKTYLVDVQQELANQGIADPAFPRSVWRTCMQALLTLMIVVPSSFWFRDALGASLATKAVVFDLVLVLSCTVLHEARWKREPATRLRTAVVVALWVVSFGAILLLAHATRNAQ
jgi:hypothetical protein